MKAALEKNGFKGCKDADLQPVFNYLEFCLKQVGLRAPYLCVLRRYFVISLRFFC